MSLLEFSDRGIHCPQADVYIDPWRAVDRAVITHAHSDHARRGHRHRPPRLSGAAAGLSHSGSCNRTHATP